MYSIVNMFIKLRREKIGRDNEVVSSALSKKLKLNNSYYDEKFKKDIKYNVTNVTGGSAIMLGAGVISGLLGIGSGVFKVIAMDTVMKMPLKPSTATSNFMMGVTAVSSSLVYFLQGSILPEIAVPVCLGVLVGAALGTRVMPKLHPSFIRVLFIIVMGFLCVQMIMKAMSVI